jgi:hypothetical protein
MVTESPHLAVLGVGLVSVDVEAGMFQLRLCLQAAKYHTATKTQL